MSNETRCETNYSINNKWNNTRNKHLTKHDTNDDVDLTIAWCTPCVERARRAHSFTLDVISHIIGSSSESHHNHLHTMHGAPSLTRFSLSTSTCSFLSYPSTSSTPSCTLSSTTRSSWKACATPPTRRVRTPTTVSTSLTVTEVYDPENDVFFFSVEPNDQEWLVVEAMPMVWSWALHICTMRWNT